VPIEINHDPSQICAKIYEPWESSEGNERRSIGRLGMGNRNQYQLKESIQQKRYNSI
jgi:hypothetical protein